VFVYQEVNQQALSSFCHFSAFAEGTILDNQQLICLYMLSQLLERELNKCLRLVVAIPMDMSSFNGMYTLELVLFYLICPNTLLSKFTASPVATLRHRNILD
jgi:hypothetical protein